MTYDWLIKASRNPELKKKIECALSSDIVSEMIIDNTFRITFEPDDQLVTVRAISEDCIWRRKIIPKKITYYLVKEVINGHWGAFNEKNVFDVEE